MLRYNYVMSVTQNAQGDFARTGGNAANQTRILTEQVKEIGTEIGQQLLPTVTDLLKWANKMLKGFNDLTPSQKKFIVALAGVAVAAGPVLTAGGKIIKVGQSIQKMLQKQALKATTKAIKQAAQTTDTMNDTLKSTADIAKDATGNLGKTSKIVDQFGTPLKTMGQGATSAAAGLSATGTAGAAAAAGTAATGTAATAATPAVKGFGVALNTALGVVGLIVVGVTALVGVFQSLGSESNRAADQIKEDADALVSSNEEITQTATDSAIAYEKNMAAYDSNAQTANDLIDRLTALREKTELTAQEQTELTSISQQLAAQFPALTQYVDENTGVLSANKATLQECVQAQTDYNKAIAATERNTELMEELNDAQAAVIVTQNRLKNIGDQYANNSTRLAQIDEELIEIDRKRNSLTADKVKEHDALNKQYVELIKESDRLRGENGALQDSHQKLTDSMEGLSDKAKELAEEQEAQAEYAAFQTQAALDGYGQQIDAAMKTKDAQSVFTQSELDNIAALLEAGAVFDESKKASYEAFLEQQQGRIDAQTAAAEAEEELKEEYKRRQEEIVEAAQNTNRAIELSDQESLEQRLENARNNVDVTSQMVDDMNFIKSKLPESSKYVDQMTTEDARMLREAVSTWETGGKEAIETYFNTLEESTKVGSKLTQGSLGDAGADANESFADNMSAEDAEENVETYFDAAMQETEKKTEELADTAAAGVKSTKEAMAAQVIASNFSEIGTNMILGALQGLNAMAPQLLARAEKIASDAAGRMSKALDEHSPSRVTYKIFRNAGKGAVLGLSDEVKNVIAASEEFTQASISPMMRQTLAPVQNVQTTAARGGEKKVYIYPQSMTKADMDYLIKKLDADLGGVLG